MWRCRRWWWRWDFWILPPFPPIRANRRHTYLLYSVGSGTRQRGGINSICLQPINEATGHLTSDGRNGGGGGGGQKEKEEATPPPPPPSSPISFFPPSLSRSDTFQSLDFRSGPPSSSDRRDSWRVEKGIHFLPLIPTSTPTQESQFSKMPFSRKRPHPSLVVV